MSSKALATILRHQLPALGISWDGSGYVDVDDLLKLSTFQSKSLDDIKKIAEKDDKERFHLRQKEGKWQICATQGHSFKIDMEDMSEINNAAHHPKVIHGTTLRNWRKIKLEGIKKLQRQHIHFAQGEMNDTNVTSGCPRYTEVYIHLDLKKAMKDGYRFFLSRNGVILSPGNKNGVIPPGYFRSAISTKGEDLL